MSELRRFLELHPSLTQDHFTIWRKWRALYFFLRPEPTPHWSCTCCPHLESEGGEGCPLKFHISPCIFGELARAHRQEGRLFVAEILEPNGTTEAVTETVTRGPETVWAYLGPSAPRVERLQCQSCGRFALPGHEVIHSAKCAWAAQQRELQPLGGGERETR